MQATERAAHHHYVGGTHKIAGRLKAAEAEFRNALALDPTRAETRYALSIVLLGQGRYPEGFELFDSRHQVMQLNNKKPPLPFPEWQGEDLAGRRIVIWPEQGFGDQIQSARFAPLLKQMRADVTLFCAPALARLFQNLGVNVIAASGEVEFPDPDVWVMSGSIPGRLGLNLSTVPNAPYLPLESKMQEQGFHIGVATQGNPNHVNDYYRSLSKRYSDKIHNLPGNVISLHPEDTKARDFQDTAEIISGLDLVISVDTSVAHLAGAMGKECWVLVPAHNTDWRWLEKRTDSPWYPSIRLFRQRAPAAWDDTINRVEAALEKRIQVKNQNSPANSHAEYLS